MYTGGVGPGGIVNGSRDALVASITTHSNWQKSDSSFDFMDIPSFQVIAADLNPTPEPTQAPIPEPSQAPTMSLLSSFESGFTTTVLAARTDSMNKMCKFPKAVGKKSWKKETYSTEEDRPIQVVRVSLLSQPTLGAIVVFRLQSDLNVDSTLSGISLRAKTTSRRVIRKSRQEQVFKVANVDLQLSENVKSLTQIAASHPVHTSCGADCSPANVFVAAVPLIGQGSLTNHFDHVEKVRLEFTINVPGKKVLVGCSKSHFEIVHDT
jgi:hypothetical protein